MRALSAAAILALGAALCLAVALGLLAGDAPFLAALCSPAEAGGSGWTWDAWITVPLAASALLYAAGTARLWSRVGIGRGLGPGQVAAYGAGWLTLAGALVSPLHRWGEGLFTAHMVEHELVMAVAAPLIVLGRPGGAVLWGLPRALRRAVARGAARPMARRVWTVLIRPVNATILHGVAIWAWHLPRLFDDAVVDAGLHRLQHLSFLLTALLFWWSLLRRSRPGEAAGHLFLTMLHTSLLGTLLALSPRLLYPAQTAGAPAWSLTPLEDQQLAGLIMWIPAGTVYAGAALAFAAAWIRRSGAPVPGLPAPQVDHAFRHL